MFNVRLAGDHLPVWEMAVHLSVAGDAFDGVFFFVCCLFSDEVSQMRSGTELSQFLRIFLPTLDSDISMFKLIFYVQF